MTGCFGTIGEVQDASREMRRPLAWTDRDLSGFEDDDVSVTLATHTGRAAPDSAVATVGDTRWGVVGDVYGVRTAEGYEPVGDESPAEFCARQFERDGLDFVSRLNGTFVAVCHQPAERQVTFVTDRLGSRPVYYAPVENGAVFSTHVQSLPAHPAVDTAVNVASLAEYCSLTRSTGLSTPLEGVRNLPVSATTTVDLDTFETSRRRYWWPEREPVDRSFSETTRRFETLLDEVIAERVRDDLTYGVLVSGGSDSRLLLDVLGDHVDDDSLVALHLSDWMSQEARTAERVAMAAGAEFRWLRRDRDYHARLLEEVPSMMNFYGRFEQAHVAGFAETCREAVDVLVSGLYTDTWFRAGFLKRRELDVPRVGPLHLPLARSVDSIDEYLDRYPEETPPFLDTDRSLREILRSRIRHEEDGTVVDHGVPYPSLRSLAMYGDVYPMWNDPDLFYWGLEQTMPHWTPFLDDRLIEFALSVPLEYQVRNNLSNAAVRRRDSDLADIPHAATGVSLRRGFPAQFVGRVLTNARRRFGPDDTPPQPYYTHEPWTALSDMLARRSFPGETVHEAQAAIRAAPFLDWDGVLEFLRAHERGEGRPQELYTLLTLLEMPVFDDLCGVGGPNPDWSRAADAPSRRPVRTPPNRRPGGRTDE